MHGATIKIINTRYFYTIFLYSIKITQQFRLLGVPHTVISALATGEPAYNNGCDALS